MFTYVTVTNQQMKETTVNVTRLNFGYSPAFQSKIRLLITEKCSRNCPGCCNTYGSVMNNAQYAGDILDIKNYTEGDKIMITGGEPSEDEDLIPKIKALRSQNPGATLYLYSARVNENLLKAVPLVDGLHFTLHAGATDKDIADFEKLQELLLKLPQGQNKKSFRLYIDSKVDKPVTIIPSLYKRVESKKWLTEEELHQTNKNNGGLPDDETLIVLRDKK